MHKFFNKTLNVNAKDAMGSNLSIVTGDIIFFDAIKAFLTIDETPKNKEKALQAFIESATMTGVGEFLDVVGSMKKIESMKEKDVMQILTLKTAKYTFEGPLITGAILAGAQKKEIDKISDLGILLGQAFQIHDDLLDIFSSKKKIGKPTLSDLDESKKTLLLWKTYNSLKARDKKTLKKLIEKKTKTRNDLLKIKEFIKHTEADKFCFNKVNRLLTESTKLCSKLSLNKKYKLILENFILDLVKKTNQLEVLSNKA